MSVIQISVIGIITVLLGIQFKNIKSEYSAIIVIVASLLMFRFGISKISRVIQAVDVIKSGLGAYSKYVGILIKIAGISYICEFTSDICKDNGFSALAGQIQIFGKLSILVTGIPVFLQLIDSIGILL